MLEVDLRDGAAGGLAQEYLEAVEKYLSTAAEFQKVQKAQSTQVAAAPGRTASQQQLDDHILAVRLRGKKTDLELFHKYMEAVSQQPMTKETALDMQSILEDAMPLPKVPRKLVDSFVSEGNASGADVGDFMDRLDMILLKARLLLKREAELLERAKADSPVAPDSISDGAKARALDATRTELINWIEEELSKASGESDDLAEGGELDNDTPEDAGATQKEEQRQKQIKKQIEEDLGSIEDKYTRYISSRKRLIETLGRSRSLIAKTVADHPASEEVAALVAQHSSTTHLQIPYLEKALGKLFEQRAHIAHKSFLNVSLGKQLKDASLAIEHLAEESQLLPDYPIPSSQKGIKGAVDPLSAAASEKPDLAGQIKPWAYASESSKIAAFESITENIEDAQMGIEEAVETSAEIDKLRGKGTQPGSRADENDSDIWLDDEGAGSKTGPIHRAGNDKAGGGGAADIFATLKLDLGLIGREHLH